MTSAGAKFQSGKIKQYIGYLGGEPGRFAVIGTGKSLALMEAVFLNGLNSHALDFDDGTNSGIIHLGSPVFSLLLPLAQQNNICVEDMLKAAAVGYEASYTMAVSMQPGHKMLGYHATGTCGVLGAVIAASYMLQFCNEERFQAFSAACMSATGMLKVLDDGSELKPYNVAKTALLALSALRIAKAGFKGPDDPLGGSRGYFKMMTGKEDIELKPALLNGTYAIQKSYTKPYASCRYTHPAVEAAIHLRERYGLKARDIRSVQVKTYSLAVAGHDHTDIPGSYSAKMSIPYSTAAGLIYGKVGLQEFSEERVRDRLILDLTKKVNVISMEALSAVFPEMQPAIVEVETGFGMVSEQVDFPKGEPENPLTDAEFRARYNDLMEYSGIKRSTSETVFDMVCQGNLQIQDILKQL